MKIALTLIADDNAIKDGFERMLASVEGKVDAVFVVFTGQDGNVSWEISEAIDSSKFPEGAVINYDWPNDFALARNVSFELVYEHVARHPEIEFDCIVWLDCDDVVPEHVDFRGAALEMNDRRAHAALMNYDYKVAGDGTVLTSHFKERVFRFDWQWHWVYPIHENCVGPMGTRTIKLDSSKYTITHMRGEESSKRKRNQNMIADWFRDEGKTEPRAVMFMAHQTLSLAEEAQTPQEKTALLKMALKLYQQFISTTPPDDDSYVCNRLVADILRTLGKFEDALNIDLQGIKMQPTWPSCYVGIAETHFEAGGYEDAITWANLAENLSFSGDELQVHDRLEAHYKPLMIRGAAQMKLGRYDDARESFTLALNYYDDEWTRKRLEKAKKAQNKAKLCERPSAAAVHHIHWGARQERSIAFFVPPSIEDWNPEKLRSGGLGGTETCVIRLAEELANRGWRVAIFGNPGNWAGRIVGASGHAKGQVEWYRSSQYHPDEPFKVFVGLRSPEIFDMPVNAELKILWLHDLTMGNSRFGDFGDRFSNTDMIVCPSPFHMKHIIKVYRGGDDPWSAHNHVITNGFDHDTFRPIEGNYRDPARFVYASSPDRGLPRLLELWPDIARSIDAKASLHIYYGWESIDAIIERGLPSAMQLAYFKRKVEIQLNDLIARGFDIHWHGRVNQQTLARDFCRSGALLYPANFQETFGIVFAQAMAAGVVPVVSDLGFLPDMVERPGGIVVPGSPDSMEFGPRFVCAVESAYYAPQSIRDDLSQWTTSFDWLHIGGAWETMIDKALDEKKELMA